MNMISRRKVVIMKLTSFSATVTTIFSFLLISLNAYTATLNDLAFSELPGGRIEVRAEFSEPPSIPKGYSIEQPARIVLDFEGVESNLERRKIPLALDNAKSAVVVSNGGRTRFIVNLVAPSAFSTRIEGNTLITLIEGASRPQTFTRQQANEELEQTFTDNVPRSITDVDFRRTEDGFGTLILTLSNDNLAVDIEQTASGVIVNFVSTDLRDELRRRLDVVDFATPVKIIEASNDGRNTQVALEVTGDYDYLAYQADNQYVVTIKPLTEAELIARQERFKYVGEKLSLNFQDIKVRAVLEIIADVTGLNLVASDTVEGNITLRLENVPWDQALDLVLKSKSLDKRQVGNVLLVAPAAEIAERERQELETRNQLQELAPLRTEFIRIRYANAKDIFELFTGDDEGTDGSGDTSGSRSTSGILSERGTAIVDERTNSVILTETEEKIAEFKSLIERLDVPIRQVMIEARIVVANDDFLRDLGVSIVNLNNSRGGADVQISGGTNLDIAETAGRLSLEGILGNNLFLDLELTALENTGRAEVVSQPKIITGDKQKATIESGKEIPYVVVDRNGIATVEFREAVLKLDVTPQITSDNRVIMELVITQDSIGDITVVNSTTLPIIDTNELITKVLVGDGQTIVLGGIFQQNTVTDSNKVPFLADIPVIGQLFRNSSKRDEKQELLIFITPRILFDSLID
ncbi:MAG: type IV pilus assembly protein PilQ [Cellvibrionaceae bacterium]|jgi:type IV pilus assembly protein PilQ